MVIRLLKQLDTLIVHLKAHNAPEEARILAEAIPSFFRRNHDYGVDYQDRVKRVMRKKKKKAQVAPFSSKPWGGGAEPRHVTETNDEGPFRRKQYNPEGDDEAIQEFMRDVSGPHQKRRHRRKQDKKPTSTDLGDRFVDHTVDQHDARHMMHDPQSDDNVEPSQHSSNIAI